jgi:hypothetical protein
LWLRNRRVRNAGIRHSVAVFLIENMGVGKR